MSLISVKGFRAGGTAAGLKKNGGKDLGLIVSDVPATAAGVFTRNRVQAAPVRLDKQRLATGRCQAVIANSGNANCCTGDKGMDDALAMSRWTAEALGIDEALVCVASTGVIGEPMPIDRVGAAVPDLVAGASPDGFDMFAEAIMTTDTVPKTSIASEIIDGKPVNMLGVAKGSGMIRPDMATMLCFIVTDAAIDPDRLQKCLVQGVTDSFNRISIDGDTSTNDTVLVMANGRSGAKIGDAEEEGFRKMLHGVLLDLAKQVVRDGEGATKLVEIHVRGARTRDEARKVADTVAHSMLVKTALFGEDANWGRIIAAAGRSGVPVDPDRIDIFFNDVQMVVKGVGRGKTVEADATRVLETDAFDIVIDLHMGDDSASIITCDFSIDYVKINADYRS